MRAFPRGATACAKGTSPLLSRLSTAIVARGGHELAISDKFEVGGGRRRGISAFASSTTTRRRVLPLRIRPAVGDQAKEAREFFEKKQMEEELERDSDWVKIQDYVAKLNPRILTDAQRALVSSREKWVGEGVAQASFDESCLSHAKSVTISCSSPQVVSRLSIILSTIVGQPKSQEGRKDAFVDVGGTRLVIDSSSYSEGWVKVARGLLSPSAEEFARISAVTWAGSAPQAEVANELSARGVEVRSEEGKLSVVGLESSGGLARSLGMAIASKVGVIKAAMNIVEPEEQQQRDEDAAYVQELVIGASWEEHASTERLFDRMFGRAARVSPGVWTLPGGISLRLVPTDDTGLKTIVVRVGSLEGVKKALEAEGVGCHAFPNYAAVACDGLDLRITEETKLSGFYSEVRWEVELSPTLRKRSGATSGQEKTSCLGAITEGAAQSLTRRR